MVSCPEGYRPSRRSPWPTPALAGVLGAWLLLCAPAALGQELPPVGRLVVAIHVEADYDRIIETARQAIVQRLHQPYSIDSVRASLQNLWALGDIADAWVEAHESEGGVALTFRLEAAVRLYEVEFVGTSPLSPSTLLRALSLREGQPLTRQVADLQAERLQQALADDGYLLARVRSTIRRRELPTRGILSIEIDAGRRTRLEALRLEGDTGITLAQTTAAIGLRPGAAYRPSRLEAGLDRLHQSLLDHRYFFAQVRVAEQSVDLAANSMVLALIVEAGPQVDLQVSGFPDSERRLRQVLSIFEFGTVEDWALKESRHQLVRYLQERGYWRPLVSYSRRRDDQGRNVGVSIRILCGSKAKLGRVVFDGNTAVDDAALLATIRSRTSRFLDPSRFVSEWWQDDQRAVVTAYRRRGYRQAEVVEARVGIDAHTGNVVAAMVIEEGAQTLLQDVVLALVGGGPNPGIGLENWGAGLGQRPGGPFDNSAVGRDSDLLRVLLANVGYPRGIIESQVAQDAEGPIVTYRIHPGERARIGRVLISGNDATRTEVIRRELGFVAGAPYSFSDMLSSQSRLYSLGIFSEVDIEASEPNAAAQSRTVVVRVREAPPMFVSYGAGFDTEEKLRGLLAFGHNNLFGRNIQGSLSARASVREQRVRLLFREPWFLGRRVEATVAGFYANEKEPSFDVQRAGGSFQVLTSQGGRVAGILRYTFRDVNTFNIKIDPDLIRREDQSTRVGSVSYTLINDSRPDPVEPTSGAYTTLDIDLASRAFGSNTDFLTLFGRSFWYRDIGRGIVAAVGTRAGVKIPYRHSTDVPLPERFFAGGSTTLRGFGLDQAGPKDSNGNSLGGEVLLIGNAELRMPIRPPLGVVLFLDVGNVFAKPSTIAWNEVREMAGIGLRYGTPVGPIRLDVARLLDRREGESLYQLFFSVGHTF